MGQCGDRHRIKQFRQTEPAQDSKETRVEIRDNTEFHALFLQALQNGQRFRIEVPVRRALEGVKHLIKIFIKSLKHPHSIEDVMDDIEPPEPFAALDVAWIADGKR